MMRDIMGENQIIKQNLFMMLKPGVAVYKYGCPFFSITDTHISIFAFTFIENKSYIFANG